MIYPPTRQEILLELNVSLDNKKKALEIQTPTDWLKVVYAMCNFHHTK